MMENVTYYVWVTADIKGVNYEYSNRYEDIKDALYWHSNRGVQLQEWFNRNLELIKVKYEYQDNNSYVRSARTLPCRFRELSEREIQINKL